MGYLRRRGGSGGASKGGAGRPWSLGELEDRELGVAKVKHVQCVVGIEGGKGKS